MHIFSTPRPLPLKALHVPHRILCCAHQEERRTTVMCHVLLLRPPPGWKLVQVTHRAIYL
ncbi:hypothetical protein ANCCAN_30184 [Ancylostoma caninum]|uniref:Uncharacterized protein n=1 Tax=Ancylostoma caninum TaxID=29170 RepID=A0A368EWU3_ANCCA|nr:hypothetical protein ANCCAN_30184 [Ancylostoma caninum]